MTESPSTLRGRQPPRHDRRYGVLRGRPLKGVSERHEASSPHYHILLEAAGERWRASTNVGSVARAGEDARSSLLLAAVVEDFRHPVTERLAALPAGYSRLLPAAESGALDYVRAGLLHRRDMRPLPSHRPGDGNDLSDALDALVWPAIREPGAVFVFGTVWGPEREPDQIFGFEPGRGMHNIHMNQGNPRGFHDEDNGVWQDGAVLFRYPAQDRWSALFLAFQTQEWRTDDRTGDPR